MLLFNYIPYLYYKNIEEIDYDLLKKEGVKALFFDLDNTIIPYNVEIIPDDKISFLKKIEKNFKIVILTNNTVSRASLAINNKFDCVAKAMKPLYKGVREALEIVSVSRSECVIIGDQILSDIKTGNKYGIKTILVNPIDNTSDTFFTKINRFFEKNILLKIKQKEPQIFQNYFNEFSSSFK